MAQDKKPSWFTFSFDLPEVFDRMEPTAFTAAYRIMRALFFSEDRTLPNDDRTLAKIARGFDSSRVFRWHRLKPVMLTVFKFGERVWSPWLNAKCEQATRKWPIRSPSEAHQKPIRSPRQSHKSLKNNDAAPQNKNKNKEYREVSRTGSTPPPPYGGAAEVSRESSDSTYNVFTNEAIRGVVREISEETPEAPQAEKPTEEELEKRVGRKINWRR